MAGPQFSSGWQVYPGAFNWNGRMGLFVYNPSTGDNWVEMSDAAGGWYGIRGPSMSPGWQVNIGDFLGDGRPPALKVAQPACTGEHAGESRPAH